MVVTHRGLRKERRWEDKGESAKPLSREFSTALRPLLVVRQGCRKLSRVPRASYFRIRHRFTPIPRVTAQLPPSTFLPLSLGYLRSLDPSPLVDDPPRRPRSRPRPRRRNESFGSDRRNLAGIDNHGDGAVFPSDFHLLSSPPLVCTQTPPTCCPLLPFSSTSSPDPTSAVYSSKSTARPRPPMSK